MPVVLRFGEEVPPRAIEERLRSSVIDDLIVVVPTKRRIRHLVREVMSRAGTPVSPAFPFHTLESLGRSLYAATRSPRRPVSGPIQTLLFYRAISSRREMLDYFSLRDRGPLLFPGTFGKIIDVVLALKESGVTPGMLAEELQDAPLDEQHKLRDIATIYRAYEEALASVKAIDAPGILKDLAGEVPTGAFKELFRRVYPHASLVSLAGFDEFTWPELGLIESLCGVPGLSVSLLFDFQPGNPSLFGHLEENYRRLREIGFLPVAHPSVPSTRFFPVSTLARTDASDRAAEQLAAGLFRSGTSSKKTDLKESVTLVGAESRKHEVELICRLIKELAARRPGRDLGAICVAMLRPQLYTALFREESARFGIPVNITDRFLLSHSPLVTYILALLTLPLNGFRREDVLRVAGSPYFDLRAGEGALDPGNLEEVSCALRITAGLDRWIGRIGQEIGREEARHRSETGERGGVRSVRRLRSLRKALADIEALGRHALDLAELHSPADFRSRFLRMMKDLRVAERLVAVRADHDSGFPECDVRAYARLLNVVEETTAFLESQDGAATNHPLRLYVEHLRMAVLRERYNVREQFGRGVLVTSIDETRGLAMEVMIVAGLVDGEFPSVYQPEVFLSARRRAKREQRHGWQDRYLFYQAVTNWGEHLYLTYPKKEGDLDLLRSSFIDALCRAADVEELAAGALESVLASEDDLYRRYAAGPLPGLTGAERGLAGRLEEVRHAVAVEQSRSVDHRLAAYEGDVRKGLSEGSRSRLEALKGSVFSVSQLEAYGQCPFKFFGGWLLQLESPSQLDERLTPLERGFLLHESLYDFFSDRRDRGLPPVRGCSEEEFAAALGDLVQIVEGRVAQIDLPDAFWEIEKELLLGRPGGRRGLVQEFLEMERTLGVQSSPAFFEVNFGTPARADDRFDRRLSSPAPVDMDGLRLRGKIDRIDLGDGFFVIADYKTGRELPGVEEMRSGTSLQLPLYLLAAEQLLHSAVHPVPAPAAGVYYSLRSPVRVVPGIGSATYNKRAFVARATSRQVLHTDADLREVLNGAVANARSFVRRMAEGIFPLTSPANIPKYCRHCDFRTMCRIQAVRRVHPDTTEQP